MTCNEFVKSMRDAGFTGKFRAVSDGLTVVGEITKDGKIKFERIATVNESREKIKAILNGN